VRRVVILIIVLVLLHVLRGPELIIPPWPAQHLWPEPPQVQPPIIDMRLYETAEMEGWDSKPVVVTAEEVRTDVHLWQRMFFYNWDLIPSPTREQGLAAMHRRFRHVLGGPEVWERMTPEDWDAIPQPLRAMAVLAMVDCWVNYYEPGKELGLDAPAVANRLRAIAMVESWFEHRAVQENGDGTRDLGIAQASDYTRSRIRWLHSRGLCDFTLSDEEYFDPWKATRALVFWFSLMLREVDGDLDLATAAYHAGSRNARTRRAREYRDSVWRLQEGFMHGPAPSPTWDWIRARSISPCQPVSYGRPRDD
jgi:hypothetical protein